MMNAITRCTRYEDLPELLTIEEFCAWTSTSRNAAYSLVHSGALDAVRFGRTIRIPRRALDPDRLLHEDPAFTPGGRNGTANRRSDSGMAGAEVALELGAGPCGTAGGSKLRGD
jgi:excisionase family DNA binding protein